VAPRSGGVAARRQPRERRADGTLRFDGGLARTDGAPSWLEEATHTSTLELTLVARPGLAVQSGPARLLTISSDVDQRNLTIGQEGMDLVVRLRRPGSDANGRPAYMVPGALVAAEARRIELAIEEGRLLVAVDGERAIVDALGDEALADWDPGFALGLGNELTANRPWIGVVLTAEVRAGGVTVDYMAPGALETPARVWRLPSLADLVDPGALGRGLGGHVLAFFALGALGPALVSALGRPRVALALYVGVGLSTEVAQLFFATREPSLFDLAVDVAAGLAGLAAWVLLQRFAWRTVR
jgi:hypothetical protein